MPTYVFDIDSTLFDTAPYLPTPPPEHGDAAWDKFAEDSTVAQPILPNVMLLERLKREGHRIVLLTAREAHRHDATWRLLEPLSGLVDALIMRPTGDTRSNARFKAEVLPTLFPPSQVAAVIDDDPEIITALGSIGYQTMQVF